MGCSVHWQPATGRRKNLSRLHRSSVWPSVMRTAVYLSAVAAVAALASGEATSASNQVGPRVVTNGTSAITGRRFFCSNQCTTPNCRCIDCYTPNCVLGPEKCGKYCICTCSFDGILDSMKEQ
ncbi:uncharacterized protein LOC117645478 isoform X1 [Thrips palmi]|uniref:Uncharacterized protein LOC117645478 isoform X1 n=1 Tax=Thrips palmi TaxID=161013 RepID=A0A6P8YVP6_THRPL|nr:uncharacterized protein LOC117645478 isoform X1 [Thrips palmi]